MQQINGASDREHIMCADNRCKIYIEQQERARAQHVQTTEASLILDKVDAHRLQKLVGFMQQTRSEISWKSGKRECEHII